MNYFCCENIYHFPRKEIYLYVFRSGSENVSETAPLTIFYNGTVAVFDVHREKVCLNFKA